MVRFSSSKSERERKKDPMANVRRIPFVLNLDDPVDRAIWEALEPLLARHRASQFIRGAVAHALGVGGFLLPVVTPASPGETPLPALSPGPVHRAKRPTAKMTLKNESIDDGDDASAFDEAKSNFLDMFG